MSRMMQLHSKKKSDGTISYGDETIHWVFPEGFDPSPLKEVADSIGMLGWDPCDNRIVHVKANKSELQSKYDAMSEALVKAGAVVSSPPTVTKVVIAGKGTFGGVNLDFGVQYLSEQRGKFATGFYAGIMLAQKIEWEKHPDIVFGETTGKIVFEDEEYKARKCICDFQTSEGLFYANIVYRKGHSYVILLGNGWKDCGFPFIVETGRYPLLCGNTAVSLWEKCERGIPSFDNVWSKKFDELKDYSTVEEETAAASAATEVAKEVPTVVGES